MVIAFLKDAAARAKGLMLAILAYCAAAAINIVSPPRPAYADHAGMKSITTVALAAALVDQSAANTLSAVIDMQGYDRVKFIYQIGAMVNGSSLSTWAVESNESNLGNATNIVNVENTSQQCALTNVANTYNNTVQILDIAKPTKRYVGVYVDAVTANITLLSVLAERFRGNGVMPIALATGAQHQSFRAS